MSIFNKIGEGLKIAGMKTVDFYHDHEGGIKFAGGVACSIGALYAMYRGTLKINDISNNFKETMDRIHEAKDDPQCREYTDEMAKRDTVVITGRTTIDIFKAVSGAVFLEAASIYLFKKSNDYYKDQIASLSALVSLLSAKADSRSPVVVKEIRDEDNNNTIDIAYTVYFEPLTSARFTNSNPANRKTIEGLKQTVNNRLGLYSGARVTLDYVLEFLGFYDVRNIDDDAKLDPTLFKYATVLGWRNNGPDNEDKNIDIQIEEYELNDHGLVGYKLTFNCYPLI